MSQLPSTRFTLLARLQDPANQLAWEEFVAVYEPAVYGFARKKGLQDADARDLVPGRAACGEPWRSSGGCLIRQRGSFRTWMFRIARNMLINFCTSRKRQGARYRRQPFATRDGRRPCAGRWRLGVVRCGVSPAAFLCGPPMRCVMSSPIRPGKRFWETAVEERDTKAVAAELGMSTGAVYIARSRVIARLRAAD